MNTMQPAILIFTFNLILEEISLQQRSKQINHFHFMISGPKSHAVLRHCQLLTLLIVLHSCSLKNNGKYLLKTKIGIQFLRSLLERTRIDQTTTIQLSFSQCQKSSFNSFLFAYSLESLKPNTLIDADRIPVKLTPVVGQFKSHPTQSKLDLPSQLPPQSNSALDTKKEEQENPLRISPGLNQTAHSFKPKLEFIHMSITSM